MKHSVADIVRSTLVWAAFAGVVLVAVPPMVLGYPLVLIDPRRAGADRYLRAIARALVKLNPMWSINVEGTRHLSIGGPFVLAVNHQSMADLIAMCFLGHDTKYLGKRAAFRVPVFGWALRIAGEVPVVRGDKESGAQALEALGEWLDRGVSVAIFPEGTRTRDGALGPFKLGAFRLAIDHQRPVVPVVISGARELLPKSAFVMKGRADVWVRVLEPVDTAGLGPEDTTALAERVRGSMARALEELDARPARRGRA